MIEYTVVRSNRKTVSIVIKGGGLVEVRCPKGMSGAQIRQIVTDKTPWIEKHLAAPVPSAQPGAVFSQSHLELLCREGKPDIAARVARFAPLVGVTYGRICIKKVRSRWGSCSAKGNLNFNCLLMLAPPEVRDYVVVHELCHRLQLNHSPTFWALVEKTLPNYRARKQWLKTNGAALIGRLP